jgi:hypothetical protein
LKLPKERNRERQKILKSSNPKLNRKGEEKTPQYRLKKIFLRETYITLRSDMVGQTEKCIKGTTRTSKSKA